MPMYKLLISPTTYGKNSPEVKALLMKYCHITWNPYGRTLKTDEFIELARGCDAVIAGTEKITAAALEALPELRVISRYGTGLDNIDMGAAERLSVKICNTPEAPARAVAELAVCLMLDAARHTPILHTEMKAGIWNKRTGFLLENKNVGIVGFGRIGEMVAGLLSSFGVNIRYYDIERKGGPYEYEPSLTALLNWAQILTLHCPVPADERPVLGRAELGELRKGAVLINTARGALIDEEALYDTLTADSSMTAALDVYSEEPYTGPLTELPNIILTPHIASAAVETRALMDRAAAENCLNGLGINNFTE